MVARPRNPLNLLRQWGTVDRLTVRRSSSISSHVQDAGDRAVDIDRHLAVSGWRQHDPVDQRANCLGRSQPRWLGGVGESLVQLRHLLAVIVRHLGCSSGGGSTASASVFSNSCLRAYRA